MGREGQKANEVCGVLKVECLKAFYVLEILGRKRIIQAVNEIDLEVSPNVIYGIAGESGCGKTTLLKTLFASIDPPAAFLKESLLPNQWEVHRCPFFKSP